MTDRPVEDLFVGDLLVEDLFVEDLSLLIAGEQNQHTVVWLVPLTLR